MADKTGIEWADSTWTPIRARNLTTGKVGWHCEHVSEACRFCYSEVMNRRLGTGLDFKPGHLKDVEIFLDERMLTQPLRWRRPRRIFVCSMTDLFADFVSDEMIDRVFAIMALAPQHQLLVLTKRGERMRDYVIHCIGRLRETVARPAAERPGDALGTVGAAAMPWPLPNVWLGVSVEDQDRKSRIDELRATPAAVRFLSIEPLLEDLGEFDLTGIDWVIVGGESGPGARPMHPDWARSLRDQCQAAGVPFFFKQWGEFAPALTSGPPTESDINRIGDHPVRVGKKAAGRLLDGREWNEIPQSSQARP